MPLVPEEGRDGLVPVNLGWQETEAATVPESPWTLDPPERSGTLFTGAEQGGKFETLPIPSGVRGARNVEP